MGVTPIGDFVVHFDEIVKISLDRYFLGQNPTYQMKQTPNTNDELISILRFLRPVASQDISRGTAILSYVGYCYEINRHIVYVYTD